MLALMLDPKFKSLKLIFKKICDEYGVVIVEKRDKIHVFNVFEILSSFALLYMLLFTELKLIA
jgi:hypothetical protein